MKNDEKYLRDIYEKHEEILSTKIKKDKFYNVSFKDNKVNVLKMVATFVAVIGITVGIAYAGVSTIWYAEFNKKYGNLLNPYEEVYIGWIPTINGVYTLNIERGKFENNEQIISRERAIEIVKEKEQQIGITKAIKDIQAEVRIDKMNSEVYEREKDKDKYDNIEFKTGVFKGNDTFYKTDERVRKVWYVVLDYDVQDSQNTLKQFTYFVDTTTGEIIGGMKWNPLMTEKSIYEDPYNLR